ncbi:MAG: hypothetical protein ACTSQF_05970 [Candidatus Heimdallarchaeaceae archaeon]
MGFYIVNKKKMEVLFCRPLAVNADEAEIDLLIQMLLDFYVKSEDKTTLKELQLLKFAQTKVLFMSKFSFLFILLSPPNYSTEMVSSQLFFFMKLFLNAFEIKDAKSAEEFLDELEGIKRREVSESLSHSFLLWNVLDLHIEDIDKRNMIEVFENVLNSIWLGLRMHSVENEKNLPSTLIQDVKEQLRDYIDKNAFNIRESYDLSESEGFVFSDIDIQKGTTTEIKREFLLLIKTFMGIIEEQLTIEGLRQIIALKIPSTVKVEWERMQGLSILQDILNQVWR